MVARRNLPLMRISNGIRRSSLCSRSLTSAESFRRLRAGKMVSLYYPQRQWSVALGARCCWSQPECELTGLDE